MLATFSIYLPHPKHRRMQIPEDKMNMTKCVVYRMVHAIRRAALQEGVQLHIQPSEQLLRGVARAGDAWRCTQVPDVARLRR